MHNLVRYCIDKGVDNFIKFKFQRKSKYVMVEHFVSNEDVIRYNLYLYVHKDKFGRYKLSKYVSKNLSFICDYIKSIGNVELMNALVDFKMNKIDNNINKDISIQRKNKLKMLENGQEIK